MNEGGSGEKVEEKDVSTNSGDKSNETANIGRVIANDTLPGNTTIGRRRRVI